MSKESRLINVTHGMSKTAIYSVWCGMISRCNDRKNTKYGGRGIKVCDRWKKFINFYLDMGDVPSKKHTIERINNNGDYEPENCRWATRLEQSKNRRSSILVEYLGKKQILNDWCLELNLSYQAMRNRYEKGWRPPFLFEVPVSKASYTFRKPGNSVKMVLDTSMGIFYDSLKDAAKAKNVKYKYLSRKMTGKAKNNTSFIYV